MEIVIEFPTLHRHFRSELKSTQKEQVVKAEVRASLWVVYVSTTASWMDGWVNEAGLKEKAQTHFLEFMYNLYFNTCNLLKSQHSSGCSRDLDPTQTCRVEIIVLTTN